MTDQWTLPPPVGAALKSPPKLQYSQLMKAQITSWYVYWEELLDNLWCLFPLQCYPKCRGQEPLSFSVPAASQSYTKRRSGKHSITLHWMPGNRSERMKEHWSRKDFDTTSDLSLCKMWMRFCFLSLANKGSTTLRSALRCPPFPLFLAFRFSATYQVHWLGGSSSKPFYCYIPQILFWTL